MHWRMRPSGARGRRAALRRPSSRLLALDALLVEQPGMRL
jgi:hypothetical protein